MDPIKVQAIASWPAPQNLQELHGFLGFANFYRCFIKNFSRLAQPLNDLTKKDTPWNWNSLCVRAFHLLKQAFIQQSILTMWNLD